MNYQRGTWLIQFFYTLLLLSNLIPVSLYVTMSTVKFFQAYFINNDMDMYETKSDKKASTRTIALNEELGQISHIFRFNVYCPLEHL